MTLILTSKKKTVMKKILFMMSLSALAFVSCQKSEIEEAASPAGQNTYTFVVNNVSETKATIGDKNGTQWPVLWAAGDQIGVYGGGQLLGVATLDEGSAGCNCGNFTLTTNASISAGDELYLSYPYTEGAEMKKGQVAEKHTLTEAGIGANGVAYAYAEYAGENTEFTLTHLNAYLKFNLSSSEFAGYSLEGITFWAKGAKLSGGVEVGNGDVVTYTGVGDYVKTTLAAPTEMSTTAQPVYVSTLPDDLTGKEVYAIVHMTKGIETVTLPVKLNGAGNIPAGSVTEVTLPALKKSLAPKWYEPVETRYIAAYGDGWCYGPENTALFTESNVAQTLEFKARGNFMKVKEPKAIKVAYACDMQKKTGGVVFINEVDSFDSEAVDGTATRKTFNLSSDYTASVAVKQCSNYESAKIGHMAALYVMGENDEIIWGTNLWLAINEFKTTAYTNGDVLDRNIGSDRNLNSYKNWKASGCYFQWGRPFAFGWDNGVRTLAGIEPVQVSESNDLAMSAANPYTLYYYNGNPYDWRWGDGDKDVRTGDLDDLWGNPNATKYDNVSTPGTKSIYDPCPQGYMVVSPRVLQEVEAAMKDSDGSFDVTKVTEYKESDTKIHKAFVHNDVVWGFGGILGGSKSIDKVNNVGTGLAYWSNSHMKSSNNGRVMWYKTGDEKLTASRAKGSATTIRCMVDKENR